MHTHDSSVALLDHPPLVDKTALLQFACTLATSPETLRVSQAIFSRAGIAGGEDAACAEALEAVLTEIESGRLGSSVAIRVVFNRKVRQVAHRSPEAGAPTAADRMTRIYKWTKSRAFENLINDQVWQSFQRPEIAEQVSDRLIRHAENHFVENLRAFTLQVIASVGDDLAKRRPPAVSLDDQLHDAPAPSRTPSLLVGGLPMGPCPADAAKRGAACRSLGGAVDLAAAAVLDAWAGSWIAERPKAPPTCFTDGGIRDIAVAVAPDMFSRDRNTAGNQRLQRAMYCITWRLTEAARGALVPVAMHLEFDAATRALRRESAEGSPNAARALEERITFLRENQQRVI